MANSVRLALFSLSLTLLAGCVHHSHASRDHHGAPPGPAAVHRPGPPPHAPAHGYRHRHHHHPDVDLVFDSGLGVYVVVGMPEIFFHREHFYRVIDGAWHRSVRIDHGWIVAAESHVPTGLAKKHRKAHKRHKKHRRHPAKYGY